MPSIHPFRPALPLPDLEARRQAQPEPARRLRRLPGRLHRQPAVEPRLDLHLGQRAARRGLRRPLRHRRDQRRRPRHRLRQRGQGRAEAQGGAARHILVSMIDWPVLVRGLVGSGAKCSIFEEGVEKVG